MSSSRTALPASALLLNLYASLLHANDAFDPELVYTGETWSVLEGGLNEGSTYLDKLELALGVDAEKAFGWQGGTLFGQIFYTNSNTLSDEYVGDNHIVSNIDNDYVVRLMELWYEQGFAGGNSLKFGLYDLNSEFDVIEPAGLFINSSHGIGPDISQSGENGPSIFPVSSLALRYFQPIDDSLSFQVAALDAIPGDPENENKNTIDLGDGALLIAELNYRKDRLRTGVGTWYYTSEADTLDGESSRSNQGLYGIVEYQLLTAAQHGGDLASFVRLGKAEETVNPIEYYLGAGLVLTNFSTTRPDDSIGLAFANTKSSDDFRHMPLENGEYPDSHELDIELTYRAVITENFALQPDIQYVLNPGNNPQLENAWVVGLRFELTLP